MQCSLVPKHASVQCSCLPGTDAALMLASCGVQALKRWATPRKTRCLSDAGVGCPPTHASPKIRTQVQLIYPSVQGYRNVSMLLLPALYRWARHPPRTSIVLQGGDYEVGMNAACLAPPKMREEKLLGQWPLPALIQE
eukprot:1155768-Pelagomonas_calceolata.AAC.3